ncbi:CBS domain-containing protein [Natronolimnohabitans innermongolicus]|uniref:Signal transduction protein with CBS domains n=1 Tax=Natronolimnohabitans innermongolicus JCM 12255 TaxID=1227499 RepID=L9WZY3_9EURY|nr:CBS domain-containing protein [Natronolimnohabitans innermongolicus]ELY55000.1 signal transduction protein with CBS domains [Natronolimnohabitans innermongolicus JCM 12255]
MPQIRTIVREEVVSAAPDEPLTELADRMDEKRVGSVVIVENDEPRGIVTDRDITLEVVSRGEDPASVTADDVMSDDLVTVDADSGIFDVLRAMEDASVRRVPAIDTDGTLAGIVTFDDFVVLLSRELGLLGEIVEAEIPPYEHT